MHDEIKFFGTDIIKYYWYLMKNQFADSSWQITISYTLVLVCVATISIVAFNFFKKMKKRSKSDKRNSVIKDKYGNIVKELLTNPEMTQIDVYDSFDDSVKKDAKYFIDMIIDIRNSLHNISYIPNIQHICDAVGVTEYIEYNLLNSKDVFETLNNILMIQLKISDGKLANYVNHKDKNIRTFARIAYMICVDNNPYKYLEDLLDDNDSDYTYLLIHYTLKWLKVQKVNMPNFQNIIEHINNERSCAFIISEMPELIDDKDEIIEILTKYIHNSSDIKKKSAIKTLNDMSYSDNELCSFLMKIFDSEKYQIQYEILDYILNNSVNNSELADFLIKVYRESTNNIFKEMTLKCLYKYDYSKFCECRDNAEDKLLFTVIEREDELNKLRKLR